MKNKIIYTLVNKDMHREMLENVPHRTLLDMAIVYMLLSDDDTSLRCITNKDAERMGLSEEALWTFAKENTPRVFPVECMKFPILAPLIMSDTQFSILDLDTTDVLPHPRAIALTNKSHFFGAGVILYDGILEKLCDVNGGKSFWLIPSSVHDWIILGTEVFSCDAKSASDLAIIISEVNGNTECISSPNEILGTHPYFYDADVHQMKYFA